MSSAQSYLSDLDQLAGEKSREKRRELLRKVTDLFFVTEDQQSGDDSEVFGEVLGRIAYELEAEARAELSKRMASAKSGPRNLSVRLAKDEIDVAKPVLEFSNNLTDDDLVDIAAEKGQDHLLAISVRSELASAVTDVIVERGNSKVLHRVAHNDSAQFSRTGFETLADRSKDNLEIQNALFNREDVPGDVFVKVKSRVAAMLKDELADSHPDISEEAIVNIVNAKAARIERRPTVASDSRAEVTALFEVDELDDEMIVKYARARRAEECIVALSLLSGLDEKIVEHCLLKADLSAFGVLCKSIGLERTTYASLLQLSLREQGKPSNTAIPAMKRYEELTDSTAQRVMRFLKVRLTSEDQEVIS